jgi:two-component system CheB/CheR fusion protein
VVVHHLDPSHESSLVDIFSRVTPLPVAAVSDGTRVESNHVYVVPPNAGLGIARGRLHLTPRLETGGLHLPIDRFLESLAHDRTDHAIGVVLTGTGADGAIGIRAIKAEGGITFAQDASAEHRSMPQSAIGTGCVDFILPADAIARELTHIGERARLRVSPVDDTAEFDRILLALARSSGIDFANYKHTTLRRRIQRRVVVNGLSSLKDYAALVERNREEARVLCEEVLIHVTSFFRDPETFETLKSAVYPRLIENRERGSAIRVWVPGCSTGEEVYSIAICLLEFLAEAHAGDSPIKVFGTDVSLMAIDQARKGTYPESIESDVSPARLQRFFTKMDGAYQIRRDVRDLCVFAKQDATRDPPFAGMDLISCRNLMIYLGSPLQERLLPLFHYALKEPGFLVLGTSETIRSFPGFSVVDPKYRIYLRTSASPRLLFDFADRAIGESSLPELPPRTRSSGSLDVHHEADRLILGEYAPPGVVVTDALAVVQFRGRTGPFLEPAPGVASLDLLRMVREELRLPLRQVIEEARTKQAPVRRTDLTIASESAPPRPIEIEVIPFRVGSSTQRFFIVLFCEAPSRTGPVVMAPSVVAAPEQSPAEHLLLQELAATRDYLKSVIEQSEASDEGLKAANEEIISSNEELRSTNEELQMAKEELQATNEELSTVNDEMAVRNAEATRFNDDLTNVLSSVDIPIVLLGRDGRIRRFTPAAARVFHVIASDLGRPLTDIRQNLPSSELTGMITDVLEHLSAVTRTVRDDEGRWHDLTVRPYLTLDNRIDGTVVTAINVDASKRAEELLSAAYRYSESVIDTVHAGLIVLNGDLRVRSANRTFRRLFGLTDREIQGRHFDEIARGEWNTPALKKRLQDLGDEERIEGYRVEMDSGGERRVFILNGRRIEKTPQILLALEDATDKERAERALQRTESGFREMLTTIAEAILMTDGAGRIVFANEMACKMFGYARGELMGLSVDALVPERMRGRHTHQRSEFMVAPSTRRMGRDVPPLGLRKDGGEFPLEVVLGSMQQEGGPLVMSFISDISGRREAEKNLRDYRERLQHMAFDAALAEERERRRIAADLHDRIGQSLALAQITLTSVRETISGAPRVAIDQAVDLLAQSATDTRSLIFDLSPPILHDLGFKAALSWLVEDLQKRHRLEVTVTDDGADDALNEASATLLFRAVRELLLNVFKHAQTTSATVSLHQQDQVFQIDVEDHGIGFDANDIGAWSGSGGFGLFSVREQIVRLGGSIGIKSAPGQGVRVSITVPVKTNADASSRAQRQKESS